MTNEMNYRITVYGNSMYKEISLKQLNGSELTIGTRKECRVRFNRDRFFSDFMIRVVQMNGEWTIQADDSIYFTHEDGLKEYMCTLHPGDEVKICYEGTDSVFFYLNFSIDFGRDNQDFDREIDCGNSPMFRIGGTTQSNICIADGMVNGESLVLQQEDGGYRVRIESTRYGIRKNGFLIHEPDFLIRDHDFFSLAGYSFYLRKGMLYTSKKTVIHTSFPTREIRNQKNHFEYPKFIRNARQRFVMEETKPEILPPKNLGEPPKSKFLMLILPLVVNFMLMMVIRGVLGNGGYFILYFAGTMIMSAIVSIWGYFDTQKEYTQKCKNRDETYRKYIEEQQVNLEELRAKEQNISLNMNMSTEESIQFVEDFSNRLFEKERTHEDYLTVYLGNGTVESSCPVTFKKQEYLETEDPMMNYPEMMYEKFRYLDNMPVVLQLRELNAVGFVGSRNKLYQISKNLVINLATSHFYKDVKIYFIMEEQDVPLFAWSRWLQNTYNEKVGIRNFMYDEASAKLTLEYLYDELSGRQPVKKGELSPYEDGIVFVFRSEIISNHPVSKFVEHARSIGFTFLFFEEHEEMLNPFCQKKVYLSEDENAGCIRDVDNGERMQRFCYPHISKELVAKSALKLACVYVDEVNLESSLTKNITLYELLKIMSPYDLNLAARWSNSKIYDSMAAPLGVKSGGEVVCLDLHEKYHGPHGLVAGTTGSGKSEIMQSYVLSMATLFHPYEVGFIVIDFKGGGMVNQFRDLPHLNGAITNIDGREIDRSLLSIRAELRKRQELFAEFSVNHIDDYIKLFQEKTATVPLPHLILIVDEFAELKSEQPDFMKELISTARIGRSLGVHLILATQKPAGVVNDQIWSNSKFKLCLKVQNQADSNEVLKSPLAAEIREPGRAYLQVGNNEIFQLFQSAYSGAPARNDGLDAQKKFHIAKVALSGQREIVYAQKPKKEESSETQLEALVNYIKEYCKSSGIERLPNICLPSLETMIPYGSRAYENDSSDICVPLGIYDDPSRQLQEVTDINITQNHVFIVGSGQSGKTNLLQAMIRGVVEKYSPEEVNIYILDFATMIMKNFEPLKHVGGVVMAGDDERMKNFIKMIQQMIVERKDALSKLGLSSYSAYRESGAKDIRQIIIMIDNLVGLRSVYPDYDEQIQLIAREGVSTGISLVITTPQTAGIGYRLLSSFSKRIALYCNESGEYTSMFEKCKLKLNNIPGRCIIELDRDYYECQSFLSFSAEKEYERIEQIRTFITDKNEIYPDIMAKRIPEIPEVVTSRYIKEQYGEQGRKPYDIPIGICFANTELVWLSLTEFNQLGISGKPKMGRSNYIRFLLTQLEERRVQEPAKVFIFDDFGKKLQRFEKNETVCSYFLQVEKITEVMEQLQTIILERYERVYTKEDMVLEEQPLLVLLINNKDVIDYIGNNPKLSDMYREFLTRYKSLRISIILANIDNQPIGFASPEPIKQLKDNSNMLVFFDIDEQKFLDVPLAFQKEYRKELIAGEAFYRKGIKTLKVMTMYAGDKNS